MNRESFNKYVCGLLDGDGCFTVNFTKSTAGDYYNTQFLMYIDLEKTNRHSLKLLTNIRDYFDAGNVTEGKCTYRYVVCGKQLVAILHRIKKHLVCKGEHAIRSLEIYETYKGTKLVDEEKKAELRNQLKWSRENTGPLKPKKHVSKAWLAGFIDADGCIREEVRTRSDRTGKIKTYYNGELRFCQHPKDHHAIELIAKSFGREWKMNNGYMTLVFHMGKKTKHTADRVLKPLIPHLVLKRWSAEQILHNLKHPQRLNSATSTDEVIVQ